MHICTCMSASSFRIKHFYLTLILQANMTDKQDHLGEKYLIIMNPSFALTMQCGILEWLNAGKVIVGDGGMAHALEKRGYVKAGPWTPECTVEHPDGGQKS